MNLEAGSPGTALSQQSCRDRMSRSRRGFLACSERALPTVAPVHLRLRAGRLLVTVHDPAFRDQLVGQVVALGIGRHDLWFRRGWRVVARGNVVPADAEDENDVALALEPYELEGFTFARIR